ncbi:MAG TPA: class I SAM-dependent methyltransferase [Tepidisphaeraceae bacterium]|nr:class I SAM-dependent methyltransferase [Tepidisphaeraceae bacterium]
MTDPTKRFSDRAGYYARWRPSYPAELVDFFKSSLGLSSQSIIADIASGTGLLTELLLKLGGKVYAVEPNTEMRGAAEKMLGGRPGFTSINGAAEATTLADASVDLVTAAQAFHWFNGPAARREFVRILAPGGYVALVWNERRKEPGSFGLAYGELTSRFRINRPGAHSTEAMKEFFNPDPMDLATFENHQTLDFEGLVGRLLSSSSAPLPGQEGHDAMIDELRRIFQQHESGGGVRIDYDTRVYYGQLT